jgi:hypothetical protein
MTAKKDHRARFLELTGADSQNFLGTGLTAQEFIQLHSAEQIAASWALQDKKERKRRLHLVMELCAELTKIKEHVNFATGLAECGIEAVIKGDWPSVKDWADSFSFKDENEPLQKEYGAVYARFCELLLQAYATRPEAIGVQA